MEPEGVPRLLTHTEERILDHLRAGTTDAEMSVRLGISVGDVKERIERLRVRHGATDRAALLAAIGVEVEPQVTEPEPAVMGIEEGDAGLKLPVASGRRMGRRAFLGTLGVTFAGAAAVGAGVALLAREIA